MAEASSVKSKHVRVAAGIHLVRLLAERGVDPDLFFAEQGLDPALFRDPNNTFSFVANARLYKAAAEATGCEGLPVLVGLASGLDELGPLGKQMRNAPNVYAALKAAESALLMQVSGAKLSVAIANDLVEVRYTIIDSEVESGGHISVGGLAYVASVMIEMCGPRCRPVSADLPLREPAEKEIFIKCFGKKLKFDCPEAIVRFDEIWMRKAPLFWKGDDNPAKAALLHDELLEIIQTACVRQSLQGVVPSITDIASQMGWSKRTLSRRLKERGTSFDEIRQKSIFGAAIRLLNDTDMSVTAIATSLGYAEIASFTRAFHSWAGYPPTQVRQKRTARDEL